MKHCRAIILLSVCPSHLSVCLSHTHKHPSQHQSDFSAMTAASVPVSSIHPCIRGKKNSSPFPAPVFRNTGLNLREICISMHNHLQVGSKGDLARMQDTSVHMHSEEKVTILLHFPAMLKPLPSQILHPKVIQWIFGPQEQLFHLGGGRPAEARGGRKNIFCGQHHSTCGSSGAVPWAGVCNLSAEGTNNQGSFLYSFLPSSPFQPLENLFPRL